MFDWANMCDRNDFNYQLMTIHRVYLLGLICVVCYYRDLDQKRLANI